MLLSSEQANNSVLMLIVGNRQFVMIIASISAVTESADHKRLSQQFSMAQNFDSDLYCQ